MVESFSALVFKLAQMASVNKHSIAPTQMLEPLLSERQYNYSLALYD
ncbi:MAG: hypothetical protein LBV23_03620 [Deltaproteobacteria bacterium]|nr:hypothetical protein [Deltaproteobacteria bacterium]